MLDEGNIAWVVRNRGVRVRTMPASIVAKKALENAVGGIGKTPGDAVRQVIADTVDAEFLKRCTLGPIHGGKLTIYVDDYALAYSLRMQWEPVLTECFQEHCPKSGIRSVRFVKARLPGQRFENQVGSDSYVRLSKGT